MRLSQAAFHERCKIHDIIMHGIDAGLRKRGYPPVEDLKGGQEAVSRLFWKDANKHAESSLRSPRD